MIWKCILCGAKVGHNRGAHKQTIAKSDAINLCKECEEPLIRLAEDSGMSIYELFEMGDLECF